MVKDKKEEKIDILNILVQIRDKEGRTTGKYKLCENFTLNRGDEINISIMKVDEKEE